MGDIWKFFLQKLCLNTIKQCLETFESYTHTERYFQDTKQVDNMNCAYFINYFVILIIFVREQNYSVTAEQFKSNNSKLFTNNAHEGNFWFFWLENVNIQDTQNWCCN